MKKNYVLVTTVSEWVDGQGWSYEDEIINVEDNTDITISTFSASDLVKNSDLDIDPETLGQHKYTWSLYDAEDEEREVPLARASAWDEDIYNYNN